MSEAPDQPALAVVELASLARAAVVLDAIVKRAPVAIRRAQRVSPGKYLILIGGGVAEVDEGYRAGLEASRDVLIDRLFLPQADARIHRALDGGYADTEVDSLGLFETYTAAAALASLDAALKATDLDLVGLHLCAGIGGKGYWALSGPLDLVEEAAAVAAEQIAPERLVMREVIPRPHGEALDAYLAVFRER